MIDVVILIIISIIVVHALYKISKISSLPFIVDSKIALYTKRILLSERDELYLKRGLCYFKRGISFLSRDKVIEANIYFAKAISDFDSSIELNKLNDEAYFQKGLLMILLNNSLEAYEALIEAESLGHRKATQTIVENGMR